MTTGVLTAALAADGRGPGPVNTTISVTDSVVQVTFLARIAGTYTLSVISVATGQPLAGMPLQESQQSQALESVSDFSPHQDTRLSHGPPIIDLYILLL